MKILSVDKDKARVELTTEEVTILVKPIFSVPVGVDHRSLIGEYKKAVELYDAVIGKLEGTLKEMERRSKN